MNKKVRVGVIMGGLSGEHEVSLVSAASVIKALDKNKFEVLPIGIAKDGKWLAGEEAVRALKESSGNKLLTEKILLPDPNKKSLVAIKDRRVLAEKKLDVIVPIVHGTYGEDGKLQGLLEMANIPYVGSGVLGSAVAMDKIVAKQIFESIGLLISKYHYFVKKDWTENQEEVIKRVEEKLSYPLFVKPANLGSSVGVNKAGNRVELKKAISLAIKYDRRIIVEEAVKEAKEIECSVLGNDRPEASVPGRVVPADEFYTYNDKYVDGKTQFEIPAKLPKEVIRKIRELAIKVFKVLDLAGMARVDFLLDRKNKIYVNEANTIPGFTKIGMYPKLWQATGLPYEKLLERLIDLAFERHRLKNQLQTSYKPTTDWYKHE
ncbi:MAG TPA: D-alanine--D-alanine ligase family protein [Patescibacteria group bacterium]|nr:D-alanine--D-alanine ligase family protein [Patescibacteria group bacterium]